MDLPGIDTCLDDAADTGKAGNFSIQYAQL